MGMVEDVRSAARPLEGGARDHDELLERVGDARLVLLGEASHGTHEFYRERALITKRLILEKGFHGVAAEADWPDSYRVNRYVRGRGEDRDAAEALGGFSRFPTWMWRNADVLDFVGWLREHNRSTSADVGFYGIDLYSLYSSMSEVVRYLDRVDPEAAARARERYACFETFEADAQAYGMAASQGWGGTCQEEVVAQLVEIRRRAAELLLPDGQAARDELFYVEQNARVALRAEEYYRGMFRGRASSWNLRDGHMMETLEALLAHLDRSTGTGRARLVVWAHNSHLGDARATDMRLIGELNLGQLVRERFTDDCLLVGFSTYEGTVTAASDWDGDAELKRVRPGLTGSYEALFHAVGLPRFSLMLRDEGPARSVLEEQRLQRAIGVIYRPDTERASHYLHARLARQFDVMIHFDRTRAVEPLERSSLWTPPGEPPETFPSAL